MRNENLYLVLCKLFILLLPLHGIVFFQAGFQGSAVNILIISCVLLLLADYLVFPEAGAYINNRLFSGEAVPLLFLLILLFFFDVLNFVYHGKIGFLFDRVGTILMVVFFIVAVDSRRKLDEVLVFWVLAGSYLALQNILSNLGITPVFEGARSHAPRIMYGVEIPFGYAAGLPGAFGWHGKLLISSFFFSAYLFKTRRLISSLGCLLCLASIVMMQSRSTYLGFITALGVLILCLLYRNDRKIAVLFILSPLVIVIGVYWSDLSAFFKYAWTGFVEVGAANVENRFYQYRLAINLGLEYPFFGIGHDNFNVLVNVPYVIHNSFLYQLASLGVAAFVVYCSLFVLAFALAFKNLVAKDGPAVYDINIFLLCVLTGITIELFCFLVISGRTPWLVIYFILLNNRERRRAVPATENAPGDIPGCILRS